jgi:hypothetical protein
VPFVFFVKPLRFLCLCGGFLWQIQGRLSWRANSEDLGADLDYDQVHLSLGVAATWGKNTLFGRTVVETTLDENAPENALFRRGGFF